MVDVIGLYAGIFPFDIDRGEISGVRRVLIGLVCCVVYFVPHFQPYYLRLRDCGLRIVPYLQFFHVLFDNPALCDDSFERFQNGLGNLRAGDFQEFVLFLEI